MFSSENTEFVSSLIFKLLSVISYELSISSKLSFPVVYNSSETDTFYLAVFKRLFSLFVLRVSRVNSFLSLNIKYMLFDEILSGKKTAI